MNLGGGGGSCPPVPSAICAPAQTKTDINTGNIRGLPCITQHTHTHRRNALQPAFNNGVSIYTNSAHQHVIGRVNITKDCVFSTLVAQMVKCVSYSF